MQKNGRFILMDIHEFEVYIQALKVGFSRKITHIQEHHTFIPSYSDFTGDNYFQRQQAMEAYHISIGFGQIAQHFTIFPDGMIVTGRPLSVTPACIKGHNTGGICIENLGNFDLKQDVMNEAQQHSVINATALLCNKFGLPVNTTSIVYHHWFRQSDGLRDNAADELVLDGHKTCPGTNFFGGNRVADAEKNFIPKVAKAARDYQASAGKNKGTVTASVLNVRSGPGVSFKILRQIIKGAPVTIYARKNNWLRISKTEWVSGSFVS
ncbi:N-acetylmuramoyl-L-alanine amidase [Pedobacter sp.]|uniref:N-acetylmuramoyl-L-alanine amidase n=1 Tax=Pedobacter sp. TaxID=1411316 RepID=UPI003BAC7229